MFAMPSITIVSHRLAITTRMYAGWNCMVETMCTRILWTTHMSGLTGTCHVGHLDVNFLLGFISQEASSNPIGGAPTVI